MPEVVSQAKIFVNIGPPISALKQLLKAKSLDVKDGRSTEVVMAVGVQGGAGFRDKEGGFEIDMTIYREDGTAPEVDWYAVKRARVTFTLTTQDEGNGRRQSYTCRVSKIDTKKDEAGTHEDTVTLVALRCNP